MFLWKNCTGTTETKLHVKDVALHVIVEAFESHVMCCWGFSLFFFGFFLALFWGGFICIFWVVPGLLRCGKSCRLRWVNYLRPDLKRGNFGEDEEDLIIKLHALLGNRWEPERDRERYDTFSSCTALVFTVFNDIFCMHVCHFSAHDYVLMCKDGQKIQKNLKL